ncbi:hypothetical protein [Flexivirga lutea]
MRSTDRLDDEIATDDPLDELRAIDELRNALSARAARLVLSEADAARLTRETAVLSGTDRSAVEKAIAPLLGNASTQQLIRAVREQTYQLDPEAISRVDRHR